MTDQHPALFGTPPLGGESAPDQFGFTTGTGESVEGGPAIFPIIRHHTDGTVDLLGTGFFIANNGLFVTAKHVLNAPFDPRTGQQLFPVSIIHFHEKGSYFIRPVIRCAFHPVADLTVGVAAQMTRDSDGALLANKSLVLNVDSIAPGAHVTTYAYPRYEKVITQSGIQIFNVMPSFYDGEIVEYLPTGRDRVMLPGPCYRTSIRIHHGASGGPVFSKDGRVFAINSTGFDGTEDSYVSSIGGILDLAIDDVVIGGKAPRSVTIRELAYAGHVLTRENNEK
jgi:Trypsin-like peptidase domain